MEIPSFGDLSKCARDILNSGYQYGKGVAKISFKTKSKSHLEVDSNFSLDQADLTGQGDAGVSLKLRNYGVLTEKWYSDGTLCFDYGINDKLINGLNITAGCKYNPSTNYSTATIGTNFKNENFNVSGSISNIFDSNFELFGAAVVGMKNLLLGYQATYETGTNALTKSDIGITYNFTDLKLHFKCSPGISNDFGLSAAYRETAVSGTVTKTNDNIEYWTCGFGTRYKLDDTSTLRLKLDTELQLGTSIQQLIQDGINLTLAFGFDLKDVVNGTHKVGLAIDIEA
ncbi:voltage-dependent anion-selective channel protein 2-like isoform X2 [Aphidius gifuensis]|uniref:voltage-dependent anion-selective channel protein 2-like isoform X2 n=1 Tax=Aphidius gifuensis TaxID=684658 RepID=UPI001CDD7065|nr:voltage-dependent anion-selective channel protein 2-like isoform X2 [Aphidius gifuensis]